VCLCWTQHNTIAAVFSYQGMIHVRLSAQVCHIIHEILFVISYLIYILCDDLFFVVNVLLLNLLSIVYLIISIVSLDYVYLFAMYCRCIIAVTTMCVLVILLSKHGHRGSNWQHHHYQILRELTSLFCMNRTARIAWNVSSGFF
jgi:hypothetical protein